MKKKINDFFSIVLPNKKINVFTFFIVILGIISGSIFLLTLSNGDKEVVVNKIVSFMNNINTNKINNIDALKNSLVENSLFIFIIWILGFSIIGIVLNIFLIYLRSFIIGFTVASFILIYKYLGILSSFIYVFPTTIINLLSIITISVYSYTFSILLFRSMFNKTNNIMLKSYIKKYFLVFLICLGISIISSLSEAFLLPSMMKLVIKLFI